MRRPKPSAGPRPLRVGSHNVRGLRTQGSHLGCPRLHALLRCWERQQLDVVCLQETHVREQDVDLVTADLGAAAQRLRVREWSAWWAPAPTPHRRVSGGVAILIRSCLLQQGLVTFPGGAAAPVVADGAWVGRGVSLPVLWGGHAFVLTSAYFPLEGPQQRDFIQQWVGPVASTAGDHVVAADFNFVGNVALDTASGLARPGDPASAAALAAACPGLVDVLRLRHPARRVCTHVHRHGATRLDRILCSGGLVPQVLDCGVAAGAPADHRLVSVTLAASPETVPPARGLPKARLGFWDFEDLDGVFREWLQDAVAARPAAPAELLPWWPALKRAAALAANRLSREAVTRRVAASQQEAVALAEEAAAVAAVEAGGDVQAAAAQAVRARCVAAAAAVDAAAGAARTTRHQWLRGGEKPCPLLTRLLRPADGARTIAHLKQPDGSITSDPAVMGQVMARYWRDVSAVPPPAPEARAQVLGALQQPARCCSAEEADQLGNLTVSVAEVLAALSAAPAGRAPGPDGIPVELYQHYGAAFAPVLAEVFTAVGGGAGVPGGFLDGVWSFSAFLTNRRIADNVLLLQLTPGLLTAAGQAPAVAAFLDFYKAYDTVDRSFLLACLERMGVGAGFLTWVSRLLSDTRGAAMVNGTVSGWVPLAAGVRQGCPLAPLLYLAVAQALLSWLRRRGHGVAAGLASVLASQYADDCAPLLAGMQAVPRFADDMEVFRCASGQRLNMTKVELLVVGTKGGDGRVAPGAAGGAAVAGLPLPPGWRVSTAAKSLGVQYGDWKVAPPAVPFDAVVTVLGRIARMPISMFGRAAAVSAYALGKVLYHLVVVGLPRPRRPVADLLARVAAVVDRRLSPAQYAANPRARPPGVSLATMSLPPACGGLGLLPLVQHVQARQAGLAVRCVLGVCGLLPYSPPWTQVVAAWLRVRHPAATVLCLLVRGDGTRVLTKPVTPNCKAFVRLVGALAHLPPVTFVAPPEPGAWVYRVPVWGNPALCAGAVSFDSAFADLLALPGLGSVGELVAAHDALQGVRDAHARPAGRGVRRDSACAKMYLERVWRSVLGWGPRSQLPDPLVGPASALVAAGRFAAAVALLPPGWEDAARAARAQCGAVTAPPLATSLQQVVRGLGWAQACGPPVMLMDYTVKAGTLLQLGPQLAALRAKHLDFVRDAGVEPVREALVAGAFVATLSRLWVLKWENQHKEALWRVASNACWAFPQNAASRAVGRAVAPCRACGVDMGDGDRRHWFWDCRTACALREAMGMALGAAPEDSLDAFDRASLWLVCPPAGITQPVWDVVCLAALSAMDTGRQRVIMAGLAAQHTLPPVQVLAIGLEVVAGFWGRLQSFVSLGLRPAGWDMVPPGHPFLARGVGDRVVLVPPPDVGSPPPSP